MHRELEICNVFWEICRNKRERSVLVLLWSVRHRVCAYRYNMLCASSDYDFLLRQHIWFVNTVLIVYLYYYIGSMVDVLVQVHHYRHWCGSTVSTWFSVFCMQLSVCTDYKSIIMISWLRLIVILLLLCCSSLYTVLLLYLSIYMLHIGWRHSPHDGGI